MKILYTFDVDKQVEAPESVVSTNEQGEEVTVTKKVKKTIPVKFAIKKPSRSMYDEAELYYNVSVSKGLQAGLMHAALIMKRVENDGGLFTQEEKKLHDKDRARYIEKEFELQKFTAIPEGEREADYAEKLEELRTDVLGLARQLRDFELQSQSIYNISAENRARTQTIVWWIVSLLYQAEGEGWKPYFEGDSTESRIEAYNEIDGDEVAEEEAEFISKVIAQAARAVTLWHYRNLKTQGEFDKAIEEMAGGN